MSYYRQQLEDWLKTLDVKADVVLDIGGAQNPVKGRTRSWEVKNYEILDLPEFDIEDFDERWEKHKSIFKKADLIFCLEVFEYLLYPSEAMININWLMKNKAKAYITFAFAYPHHNELEKDSLRYTEFGIKRLANSVGLKVNNIWYRRDKSGLLKFFYATDGMRAAKEYPHHDVTGFICELTKE